MFRKAESITMQLSGVHNTATQKAAVRTLKGINGVRSVTVDRRLAVAAVTFYPEKTTVSALTKALADAGFPVV